MTRIAPVPEKGSGPIVRASYRQARRMAGAVPDPVAVMAHSPAVLMTYGALETGVKRQRRVDKRLKELAWMKAATLMGCAWCIDFGQMELAALGVGEDLLGELPDHRASGRFNWALGIEAQGFADGSACAVRT